jgi:hypothetical protein
MIRPPRRAGPSSLATPLRAEAANVAVVGPSQAQEFPANVACCVMYWIATCSLSPWPPTRDELYITWCVADHRRAPSGRGKETRAMAWAGETTTSTAPNHLHYRVPAHPRAVVWLDRGRSGTAHCGDWDCGTAGVLRPARSSGCVFPAISAATTSRPSLPKSARGLKQASRAPADGSIPSLPTEEGRRPRGKTSKIEGRK